jgi:3-oxoisoapionate kinase
MMTPEVSDGKLQSRVAFYGDDFTGASENMAQYHRHGLRTFMFLDRPSPELFAQKVAEFDVVGIAGIARSLGPEAMAQEVEHAFRLIAEGGIRFVQYKLCSTFDSSRMVGNLGVVADLARRVFPDCFLPVFAATPEFGRYTVFGHHFARYSDRVFRLDRHPSMSRHPTTPMAEADLGRILEEQGTPSVGLIDIRALDAGDVAVQQAIARERARTNGPIVFDGIREDHCPLVAEAIWKVGRTEAVVVMSAQGFAHGFGRFWNKRPAVANPPVEALSAVDRLLVVSGSAAPLTARQIDTFAGSGAVTARLKVSAILDPAAAASTVSTILQTASEALSAGRSVCIFTALGPDDVEAPALREVAARMCLDHGEVSRRIGSALADVALRLIRQHGLGRVVIAGGDTSSYALRSMMPEGLTVVSGDYATGAHVFRLSGDRAIDGLEVTLKGGQVGDEGFFIRLRDGRAAGS